MKTEIHKHDNNAQYKSSKTNVVFNKDSNKMVHATIESLTDEEFNSQMDNAKLIRVFHSDDERLQVKELVNNLSLRGWSDDVQTSDCSNGSLLTIIRKVARVIIDDSSSIGRFAPVR
tara:strand:+ start:238 stop:588 length:351 start_codon:yes stop_codon:yes gene_type:complete